MINVSSGMGSFALTHDPERVESKITSPLYTASKAAVTMLTTQYAKAIPGVRFNAADPGYTATDLNGHSGPQTVTIRRYPSVLEGADIAGLVRDVLGDLLAHGNSRRIEETRNEILATMLAVRDAHSWQETTAHA